MTLENLLRIGRLKAHVARRVEIDRLLVAADRALQDAGNDSISADTRFLMAYKAIMEAAMAAMLSAGYRPVTSEPGHHQLVIQALPLTAGIDPARVQLLDMMRTMRNRSEYSGDPVSEAVALETIEEAKRLVAEVRARIESAPDCREPVNVDYV